MHFNSPACLGNRIGSGRKVQKYPEAVNIVRYA